MQHRDVTFEDRRGPRPDTQIPASSHRSQAHLSKTATRKGNDQFGSNLICGGEIQTSSDLGPPGADLGATLGTRCDGSTAFRAIVLAPLGNCGVGRGRCRYFFGTFGQASSNTDEGSARCEVPVALGGPSGARSSTFVRPDGLARRAMRRAALKMGIVKTHFGQLRRNLRTLGRQFLAAPIDAQVQLTQPRSRSRAPT